MISISLCMIVKNEEDVLGRCLESVKDAVDEIIIVDTGSEDKTKDVAGRYTDQVYDFIWRDDFSAARNFALSKGHKNYLMWLDADDVISEENRQKLKELKVVLTPDVDVVMMPYAVAFDESGRSIFSYYRERLVKNHSGFCFLGRVHEVIPPRGKIHYADILIEHRKEKEGDGSRNLRIYEEMEREGEAFDSRALYYYGRELVYHKHYERAAEVLQEFLKRPDSWVENRIDATRQLAVCRYAAEDEEGALEWLLKAFAYDIPRGETCCDLGRHFLDRDQYEQAVYWYEQALKAKKASQSGAFVAEDCYGFLPAISLCVCYDRMGDRRRAEAYNELAGQYKPDSPYYLSNKSFFAAGRKETQDGAGADANDRNSARG